MKESQRKIQISPRYISNDVEREKLFLTNANLYPQEMPCAMCGHRWMQHRGEVCPVRPGGFKQTVLGMIPIMPVFYGSKTAFVPDIEFYKEPNFDVV